MTKQRTTYLLRGFVLLVFLLAGQSLFAQYDQADIDSAIAVVDTAQSFSNDENNDDSEDFADEVKKPSVYPDTFYLRNVPDDVRDSLKSLKKFAYANDPAYWKDEPVEANNGGFWMWLARMAQKGWVKALFWILLIGFLVFVIVKIAIENKFFIFYSSVKKNSVSDEIPDSELMSEDINARIREAEQQGLYREATRYHFLRVLQQLNKQHYISYDAQLTNSDYIRQLKDFHSLDNFRSLAYIYDYVWYGEFEPNEQQYSKISKRFSDFYNVI